MAINPVTVFTAARMAAIEALAVVGAQVVGDNLVMTRKNGTTFVAGNVRGNPGTMTQAEMTAAIQALLATTGLPANVGSTASRGVATTAARSDHVHVAEVLSAYTALTLGSGWTGTAQYTKTLAGQVTVVLQLNKANFVNNEVVAGPLPVGFRPAITTVAVGINSAGSNEPRGWYIDQAGAIMAAGTNTGSIWGSMSYKARA